MVGETNEEKDRKLDEKTDELLLSLFNALADYDKKGSNEKKLKEYLIHQAIMNAYKDATNQGAFNAVWYKICHFEENKEEYINLIPLEKRKELEEKKSGEKLKKAIEKAAKEEFKEKKYPDSLKGSAVDTLGDYLKKIPSLDEENYTYDDWHSHLCEDLMKLYKKYELDDAFTYGNAQKWVNMAVKYLYVYASLLDRMDEFSTGNNPFRNLLDQEVNLHVPIDRYIIKAVFNSKTRNKLSKDLFIQENTESYNYANSEGKLRFRQDEDDNTFLFEKAKDSDYCLSWSKIGSYGDYHIIQEKIQNIIPKNIMSPMEWENKVWLEMTMI